MARRNPPLRWDLPDVINPPTSVCYKINVPNDRKHIGAFLGAMFLLTKPYAWANDPGHTALEVAAVWRVIFDQLVKGSCGDEPTFSIGTDGNEDFMIRQNPDNPCILESSVNGTDWCQWADLSLCADIAQPGGGAEQPGAGQCSTYHAQMAANNKWILPTVVKTGDTIEVLGLTGATNDGSSNWFCPNGLIFFAGACVGVSHLDGSDPLPTAPHQSLIANIAGTYYSMIGGTFTVPGGIANEQVIFQINDASLSDDSGSLTWDAKVCNNAPTIWTHTFDFTLSDWGFTALFGDRAQYVAGQGWTSLLITDSYCQLEKTFPSTLNLTAVGWQLSTPMTGPRQWFQFYTPTFGGAGSSNSSPLAAFSETVAVSSGSMGFGCDDGTSFSGIYITKCILSGTGTDPF